MKHFLSLLSLFILLTFNQTVAQVQTALPFLYLSPSPQSSGLGWTGVSVPNNDAFGFHYNPAMLGYLLKTIIYQCKLIPVQLIG